MPRRYRRLFRELREAENEVDMIKTLENLVNELHIQAKRATERFGLDEPYTSIDLYLARKHGELYDSLPYPQILTKRGNPLGKGNAGRYNWRQDRIMIFK